MRPCSRPADLQGSGAKGGGWAGFPWALGAPGGRTGGENGQQGQVCVWPMGQAGDGGPVALVQVPGSPRFWGLSSRLPVPQL